MILGASLCKITVACVSVTPVNENMPCQELVAGGLTWNFTETDYTDEKIAPGEYVYEFNVSTGIAEALTK